MDSRHRAFTYFVDTLDCEDKHYRSHGHLVWVDLPTTDVHSLSSRSNQVKLAYFMQEKVSLSAYIAPIKKRWVYHFIISPKTSVLDKPEWYLNQTLKWIHEHIDDVESKVELNTSQLERFKHYSPKQVFILSMIELAIVRLKKDMKGISKSSEKDISMPILIHTYNEVIQFVKVIRQLLGSERYSQLDEPYDILSVFSNDSLFETIVDVEWEYAERILRETTSLDNSWAPVLEGDFVDSFKIPRCIDRFILQIKSITERVECFKQLDCQFKLIELQCFLFNKFLSFLKKSVDSTPARMNILSDILFFGEQSTIDQNRIERVQNGVNFLRLLLIEKFFIPPELGQNLNPDLVEKYEKLTHDYKSFHTKLVDESMRKQYESQLNKTLELNQARWQS